jgi:hypothetical protein
MLHRYAYFMFEGFDNFFLEEGYKYIFRLRDELKQV